MSENNDTESVKPKIYLAGSVQYADDGGHGWREELIENASGHFEFLNPLAKYDGNATDVRIVYPWEDNIEKEDGVEYVTTEEIVRSDKEMIVQSDAILIGYQEPVTVWGTPQEQMYSYDREIPTVYWWGDFRPSPWAIHHAEFYSQSLDECLRWLEIQVGEGAYCLDCREAVGQNLLGCIVQISDDECERCGHGHGVSV